MALTAKQQLFVAEYVKDFNGTRAAERAGYKGNPNTLAVTAYDLLRNPKIAEEIERVIADRCMTKTEVLTRLAEHARGDMGDFVSINNGLPFFDLSTAPEQGKMRLIKKFKTKTRTYVIKGDDEDGTPVTEVDVELELYDAQAALVHIGRHHKLFTDKSELTGKDGAPLVVKGYIGFSPDDWDNDANS